MTMEVDLDRELMNSFKTMNTTDKDVLIKEFLRVSTKFDNKVIRSY